MELNDILQVERDTEETTASGSIVAKGELQEENNSGAEEEQTAAKHHEERRERDVSRETTGFRPKTDEEERKEAKKRKINRIIAIAGDGISKIADLYFATKYAPIAGGGEQSKTGRQSKNDSESGGLLSSLNKRYEREDASYNKQLKAWQKEMLARQKAWQKEEEERLKAEDDFYQISKDGFGLKASSLAQKDFVEELFNNIEEYNTDKKLTKYIEDERFKEEPIWVKIGTMWSHTEGNNDRVDLFKKPSAAYLKREIIKNILGDEEYTTPENLQRLRKIAKDFEEEWIPLK